MESKVNLHVHDHFTHEELSLGGNSIRLITLHPDHEDSNPITCDICQYPLHRRPAYVALSYTWGPPTDDYTILLNGKSFHVRKNLYDCLYQLRQIHHEPITLWIDALCIDQDNISERNHVVQLMDQVYERSEQVYIWLGKADDDSHEAIDFLFEVSYAMEKIYDESVDLFLDIYMFPALYHRYWVSIARLFKKDYWSRLWIIQETLLAPALEIYCGKYRINWKHVERVVNLIWDCYYHYDKRRPERSALPHAILNTLAARMVLRRCDRGRYSGGRETYPTLHTLLENFKDSLCFDSRDEIFGLLSIAGDFHDKRIHYIDYNLRPTEVFIKFLEHTIKTSTCHDDDETIYNIRRLSDALRLDVFSAPSWRNDQNIPAEDFYIDLTTNNDDLKLTLPCRVILKLVETPESTPTDSAIPTCVLHDYFGPTIHNHRSRSRSPSPSPTPSLSSPSLRPLSVSIPSPAEEIHKLRHLAHSKHTHIRNAYTSTSTSSDLTLRPTSSHSTTLSTSTSSFKYFTQPASSSTSTPCFGITCSSTQPGDLLVRSKESELIFAARESSPNVYDVIGTAVLHEESASTLVKVKTSIRRFWSGYSGYFSPSSMLSPASATLTTPVSPNKDRDIVASPVSFSSSSVEFESMAGPDLQSVRFNPLMQLMIVNEPNWRKSLISTPPKNNMIHRLPTSFVAIQPRGDDDPVLKSFGLRTYTGQKILDRAANRVRDRAAVKIEEIRELAWGLQELDVDVGDVLEQGEGDRRRSRLGLKRQ